jgi:alkanesulfonate monooxygenase SsuD/methylene tetrahydromethanopterin reductase-like flavin-dependent oxidoreductase (luciferase family)
MMLKAMTGMALSAGDAGFETVPLPLRPAVRAYASRFADLAADRLHLEVWEGMYTLPASERRFVTPDAIRAVTLIGERDEILERVAELAAVGVTQIAVFGCFDNFRAAATEVARNLIGQM